MNASAVLLPVGSLMLPRFASKLNSTVSPTSVAEIGLVAVNGCRKTLDCDPVGPIEVTLVRATAVVVVVDHHLLCTLVGTALTRDDVREDPDAVGCGKCAVVKLEDTVGVKHLTEDQPSVTAQRGRAQPVERLEVLRVLHTPGATTVNVAWKS